MTTVTMANGQTYQLDWNLYAQMMLERMQTSAPDAMNDSIVQSMAMVLAAIHGGTEGCTLTLETLPRMIGKDMDGFRRLCEAAATEVNAFREFNEAFAIENKKKVTPTNSSSL